MIHIIRQANSVEEYVRNEVSCILSYYYNNLGMLLSHRIVSVLKLFNNLKLFLWRGD